MSHRERLLKLLWDRQWHSNTELAKASGYRYGAVVHNLRGEGYLIETKRVTTARWEYRLLRREPVKP